MLLLLLLLLLLRELTLLCCQGSYGRHEADLPALHFDIPVLPQQLHEAVSCCSWYKPLPVPSEWTLFYLFHRDSF